MNEIKATEFAEENALTNYDTKTLISRSYFYCAVYLKKITGPNPDQIQAFILLLSHNTPPPPSSCA